MTASQPSLFAPGWEQEEPPRRPDFAGLLDRACADYRAQQRRWADGIPDAAPEQPDGPTVAPLSDYGRSATRRDNRLRARVHVLAHTGSYL